MYKVECPYCEKECEVDYIETENFDFDCEHCGEEFEIQVEVEYSLNSLEIVYKKCMKCGCEYRDQGRREVLCEQCYLDKMFERRQLT